MFSTSKLQTHSGINMSQCSTESGLNLFLIPSRTNEGKKMLYHKYITKNVIKIISV